MCVCVRRCELTDIWSERLVVAVGSYSEVQVMSVLQTCGTKVWCAGD